FLTLSGYYKMQTVLDNPGDARAPGYLATAAWLRANTSPADQVAVVEIGYLGYFTENRIVDLVGLVEPAFTENGSHLALNHNFWQAEPEYLLYSSTFDFLLASILQDSRFAARYQAVAEFPRLPAPPLILYRRLSD
ncbi:MAG: hypothetical protein H0T73_18900, partial [Ardenticatenales bacterium]|nr:hypothetical protein [Ardenticatenales bacterium]